MGNKTRSNTTPSSINKKQPINPGIYVLVVAILFFVSLGYLHYHPLSFAPSNDQELFLFLINGETNQDRIFSMSEDQLIAEDCQFGPIIIEIYQKRARVKESGCLNQTCVQSGWIQNIGETVVCAPNKIMIRIQGSRDTVVPELYTE